MKKEEVRMRKIENLMMKASSLQSELAAAAGKQTEYKVDGKNCKQAEAETAAAEKKKEKKKRPRPLKRLKKGFSEATVHA